MQINRMSAAAVIAAAVIAGLFLLTPGMFPAQDTGDRGDAAAPVGPTLSPAVTVPGPRAPETGSAAPAGPGDLRAEIDPMADICPGRPGNITVRGTTNLQPGEPLRIDFIAESMHPSPMEYRPDLWFARTATVTNGTGGTGTWSAEAGPGDFRTTGRWQVLVTDLRTGRSIGSGSVNVTA